MAVPPGMPGDGPLPGALATAGGDVVGVPEVLARSQGTLLFAGTVGLSFTREVRSRPSGPSPVMRHLARPWRSPSLNTRSSISTAEPSALTVWLTTSARNGPTPRNTNQAPKASRATAAMTPTSTVACPWTGRGWAARPGCSAARGRALDRLLAALADLAAGLHRRLAAGADAHVHSGRR